MHRTIRFILTIGIIGCLVGCGFHLRGVIHFPPKMQLMAVTSNPTNSLFTLQVKKALQAHGIQLVHLNDAHYHLVLTDETLKDYQAGISADGIVRQHELRFSVIYELYAADGYPVAPPTKVTSSQIYTQNNDRMLASDNERQQVAAKLHHDVIIKLLRQLKARSWQAKSPQTATLTGLSRPNKLKHPLPVHITKPHVQAPQVHQAHAAQTSVSS